MPFHNPDVGKNNPLSKSLFVEQITEGVIAPGSPEFIVTESFLKITTESGIPLITEG